MNREHRDEAAGTPDQGHPPGHFDLGTEGRIGHERLQRRGQIEHPVGGQEEHRDHTGDGVQVPERDRDQGDGPRDPEGKHGLALHRVNSAEGRRDEVVIRESLKGARCGEDRADGARENGAPQPPHHKRRRSDLRPHHRVVLELLHARTASEHERNGEVDQESD